MPRLALALALTGLSLQSGCDNVFELTPVHSYDASERQGGDANGTEIDAMPCTSSVTHDEDGDGLNDDCDLCPTVPNSSVRDDDGDQLPNACDGNFDSMAPDALVRWWPLQAADQADFVLSGVGSITQADAIEVRGNSPSQGAVGSIATKATFSPTGVDVTFDAGLQLDPLQGLELTAGGMTCRINTCNGQASACVTVVSPNANQTSYMPGEIRRAALWHDGTGVHCLLFTTATSSGKGASGSASLGTGTVTISAKGNTTAVIKSVAVYGAK